MYFGIVLIVLIAVQEIHGGRIDRRIIGGSAASIESMGYLMALSKKYIKDGIRRDFFFCGGSLVAPKVCLTACHCIHKVEVPDITLKMKITCHSDSGGVSSPAAKKFIHPKCALNTFEFDFAVVISVNPFNEPTIKMGRPIYNEPALIAGWGITAVGGYASPCLMQATVLVIPNEQCIKESKYPAGLIKDSMFCASAKGVDSCSGDSGGPLVQNGNVTGVVSFGFGCANASFPGVYANILEAYYFVITKIKQYS